MLSLLRSQMYLSLGNTATSPNQHSLQQPSSLFVRAVLCTVVRHCTRLWLCTCYTCCARNVNCDTPHVVNIIDLVTYHALYSSRASWLYTLSFIYRLALLLKWLYTAPPGVGFHWTNPKSLLKFTTAGSNFILQSYACNQHMTFPHFPCRLCK